MADSSSSPSVQLGCGTLILIAIIVAVFSNLGLKGDVEERFQRIEQRLDGIDARLDAIGEKLGVPVPEDGANTTAAPTGSDPPVEAAPSDAGAGEAR